MRFETNLSQRHLVRSYPDHQQAQRAVDSLNEDAFPVERLTIVADDLRLVENLTGRRGYAEDGLGGAASGALVGALLGLFLGAFSLISSLVSGLVLAIYGAVLGSVIGLVVGVLAHLISAGRRGVTSVRSVEGGRYDVVADTAEHAEQAARRLEAREVVAER